MADKPSVLFLAVLGIIGSALLSPLTINGESVVVLIIPLTLVAVVVLGLESALALGIILSLGTGLVVASIEQWEILAYAIASTIGAWGFHTYYPKTKDLTYTLIAVVVTTIVLELLLELTHGENILFRAEQFLGTNPQAGVRVLVNIFVTIILYEYFAGEKK